MILTHDDDDDDDVCMDEVVRPCAKNGPGETAEGHVLGDAGR